MTIPIEFIQLFGVAIVLGLAFVGGVSWGRKNPDKVEKLNLQLEKLNRDESILYETIKKRYPNLTDEEIVKEIHQHLDK